MSYNNTREDDDKEGQGGTVDQSKNNGILDGEARKDSNKSNKGDPELMWFKKWKLQETKMDNEEEKKKENGEKPEE
jgi:hypothetical protein